MPLFISAQASGHVNNAGIARRKYFSQNDPHRQWLASSGPRYMAKRAPVAGYWALLPVMEGFARFKLASPTHPAS